MTQDVIDNKLDFMTEDPTGDLLPQVKAKYSDRFRLDPNPPNTYWFFLNETVKPFDSLEARQAVNYAIDSRALQRIFGGRLEPTLQLPAAGLRVDRLQEDRPVPVRRSRRPAATSRRPRSSSRSPAPRAWTVTVWGNNKDPRPAIVDYLRDAHDADRLQGQDEDPRPAGLLRHDRRQEDQGPGGIHRLVPGLPAPGGLLRAEPLEEGAGVQPDVQLPVQERPGARRGARRS